MTSFMILLLANHFANAGGTHSVARQWNEILLEAIRNDYARPTVHARNLFHVSAAMYDAWAAYDQVAANYFIEKPMVILNSVTTDDERKTARQEALSYAAYRVLKHRFRTSPGADIVLPMMDSLFTELGYDSLNVSEDFSEASPAALGNMIAKTIIEFGLADGSNELSDYGNQYYQPVNPPLDPTISGNPYLVDPNRWQPLTLGVFIDQSGHQIPITTPEFLGAEWGEVSPFSLKEAELTIHSRNGYDYWMYHDPGPPPYIDTTKTGGMSEYYKWGFILVAIWASHLTPDNQMIDISPASIGNITHLPETVADYSSLYDLMNGGDRSTGHSMNPSTGLPYETQMVSLGDYTRVLAEFWADGPDSETPPGHWFTILNYVNDHPLLEKRFKGEGPILDDLEWDVKSYFLLGGTMHDAAVAAWGVKGWYDYIRPISAIRSMAERGQCSDPDLPHYHPGGIPLVEDYIELVSEGDYLAGPHFENVGKIKLYTWRGHYYIADPETQIAGVGWILAEDWWPYQRTSFITPPFAGYVSGHSVFSRTAAEVLTFLTGDAFFPGGMGEFYCKQNAFLAFENGPENDVTLQWATYQDASDQCSLSRIWGGIHPPIDDIPGRKMGIEIGKEAFAFAEQYFNGQVIKENENDNNAPQNFVLSQNYPNPFNSATTISYSLPKSNHVHMRIVDVMGREVITLIDNQEPAGYKSVIWNGTNRFGEQVNSGVYIGQLRFGNVSRSKKMILVK